MYDNLSSIQKGMYIKEVVVLTFMYNSLFYCAGKPNFLQKNKKEITLLSSHGPRKRTDEDNEKFVEALEQLLDKVMDFQ